MTEHRTKAVTDALAVPPRVPQVSAPPELIPRFSGRLKRTLGDYFGLTNFGVNIVQLASGAISSLRHAHSSQDEFVYIVQGEPTLVTDDGETILKPGSSAGFKAGTGNAHQLVNRTQSEIIYLEVGDRSIPDDVAYPDDDLAVSVDARGKVDFRHKDGTIYEHSES
ncbi:MAG: cupin domain-containing protein [Alphaproteobacteria bacterium]